jgi:hypothetical protein
MKPALSCLVLSTQEIARPLVAAQEDSTAHTDPPHPRPYPREERPGPALLQYRAQHGEHGLFLPRQHHPRLQNVQRRREPRGHGARHRAQQSTLQPADLRLPRLRLSPALQRLPERELDHGERDLADDCDAPPAIQLAPDMSRAVRTPLSQDMRQRRQTTRMLAGLRALLNHLCRHADGAGRDLCQTGRQHVCSSPAGVLDLIWLPFCVARGGGAWRQGALDAVVGDEEEGGAGRGAPEGGAHAFVHAAEAARGGEAGGGLEARFQRVQGEERHVDGCAC